MPVGIDIQPDQLDLRRLEVSLRGIKNGVPRALADGANHVRKKSVGARVIAKEVTKELTVKVSTAKKSVSLGARATPHRPRVVLKLRDRRLPNVMDFRGTRVTKEGLSVRFRHGQTKRRIRGSFRATVESGKRVGLSRYRTYRPRVLYRGPRGGKTRAVTGPSVTGVVTHNPGVRRSVGRKLNAEFFSHVDLSVRKLLARYA